MNLSLHCAGHFAHFQPGPQSLAMPDLRCLTHNFPRRGLHRNAVTTSQHLLGAEQTQLRFESCDAVAPGLKPMMGLFSQPLLFLA